jgi:hypothetical protein
VNTKMEMMLDLLNDQQRQISLLMDRNEQLEQTVQRHIQTTELEPFTDESNGSQQPTKRQLSLGKMPESCEDLWYIGHRLNGFHDVKGANEIRSVYCDFTKLPGDQGNTLKCHSLR